MECTLCSKALGYPHIKLLQDTLCSKHFKHSHITTAQGGSSLVNIIPPEEEQMYETPITFLN